MLMMEITEDLSKWKEMPYSWIGRLDIVKMSVISKLIYRFNAVPIKFPARCFEDMHKLILKCMWKGKDLEQLKQF